MENSNINSHHLNEAQYRAMYQQSIDDPSTFWNAQAKQFISWFAPWDDVSQGDFHSLDRSWFTHGQLNACYNCVDRHLDSRRDQIAILWEGNNPDDTQAITYGELHERVCTLANGLKQHGIRKGSRVCIYLPMIPEAVIAMLACARLGAIHSVVFGGFAPDALQSRILDANCTMLITADEGLRGSKHVPLKKNADQALRGCPDVQHVIVVQRTGSPVDWQPSRDHWYHDIVTNADSNCPPEIMDANDPLFILYTSGSTGKPKGMIHGTGGYLVYAAMTHHYIFDYHDGDIHWCTADVGWITGHTYLVYGPLANGATTLLFEGVPDYPTFSRYWDIIDKHQVSIFYTAPTALRALRREGDQWVQQSNRKSLKLLGTVGEPINPDVWEWYYHVVGEDRCPIVNTWWQTETGGIMLTPLPGATPLAHESVGWPFFGIVPDIVDAQGQSVDENQLGQLVIKQPWPGLMQTINGDKQRFFDLYLHDVPGNYFTGDGAYRDQNGYYWITGRNDDVIKVSGHRLGTEELESALISHPSVAEAAVVGVPHPIKGEGIYAFVTTKIGVILNDTLKTTLIQHVRDHIGPIATLETIQWAPALPKTRSGKIMRRILRKIANGQLDELGDVSSLADPSVVDALIRKEY